VVQYRWPLGEILQARLPDDDHSQISESEARFRAIFENAAVGIARVALDGRFLEFNQRLCDIVGYSHEELAAKTFREITHPEDVEADLHGMRQMLAGEIQTYLREKRYNRKDGSVVWVNLTVSLARKPDGALDYFISIIEDISARKRAEQDLRERDERLFLATRTAGLGIFEWDVHADRAIWENERMYEIFGHSYDDGVLSKARFIARYIHPDDVAGFERALAEGMKSGHVRSVYRIHRKDGALRWLELAGNFELKENEPPARMIGVLADITERKHAEAQHEQLAQEQAARAAAEAANRSKDEFLAMVSHELRSPLNAILGYARLLRSGPLEKDTLGKITDVIERNTKSQLRIVEDLLDSARIATGKLRIEPVPVELTMVLEAALDTVRAPALAKGITLAAEFGAPEIVLGDPTRLQQIVWNLLANAVKFTPEGGRVELRMERVGEEIHIIVRDTGKGIRPDFMQSVFNRFTQAEPSITKGGGGLGMGLSLARHLAELHGGAITAASEGVGRGATFTVILPRRPQEFVPEPQSVPQDVRTEGAIVLDQPLSLEGAFVLLIDDQEEVRTLLTEALRRYGAEVAGAPCGAAALALLSNPPEGRRPDVLIVDLSLSCEDGYAVLREIRRLERMRGGRAREIPAIALTPFDRTEDRLRALRAGFHICVAKPVEPAELALAISNFINKLRRQDRI
jgi:PAS domain S-box-containing protein